MKEKGAMKRSIVLLAFVVVFIGHASNQLAAYDSVVPDTTPTKFEGIWGHLNKASNNDTITFTGNAFLKAWDGGSVKGRFTFDSRKITFLAEDGKTWTTDYKLTTSDLSLTTNPGGEWHWYGTFSKNLLRVYKDTDKPDSALLTAIKLRDLAASAFFYDGENDGTLDGNCKNILEGSNEKGGVCTDYAMELAYAADHMNLENYIVVTGSTGNKIAKVSDWLDADTYNFRVRSGRRFGVNTDRSSHYDGVIRDSNFRQVKNYTWVPPHPWDKPRNHQWNIVRIENRLFVIDANYYDVGSGNGVDIIEVVDDIEK